MDAIALAGAVACAVAGGIARAGSTTGHPELDAFARAFIVGAPIGAGLYARLYRSTARFGTLLVVAGFAWFFTTLAGAADPWVYSVGRIAGWVAEPLLVYLVLAFPVGRIVDRTDQRIAVGYALLVACLFLPTALLVDHFPEPSPWSSCDPCPSNAFMVLGSEPGIIADVVRPVREVLTVGVYALVAIRLGRRMRTDRRRARRIMGPVLAVAILHALAFVVGFPARQAEPHSTAVAATGWVIALTVPVLALAFVWGIWRWRLFLGSAMHDVAVRLRHHPDPGELRAALAGAFEDERLDIVYWVGDGDGHWADAAGHPTDLPPPTRDRAVTIVRDGTRRVAAIMHDATLSDEEDFVDTASAFALMTLENHRLTAQTAVLLREVEESRARIQTSADEERRRIEHDLHDGAQQRLVALRIKLELAAEHVAEGGVGPSELRGLGQEVEDALDEVRSLARGIYPAPLADRGLVDALRSAALHATVPTTVLAAGVGRYPRAIESAGYFCCLEALQNATKHAKNASAVVIELSDNGSLHLEVRDDGVGFDPKRVTGTGTAGMRDRVAAVGGTLTIHSRVGRGTRVSAKIPIPRDADAAEP